MTTELLALVGLIVLAVATLRARASVQRIGWDPIGSALLVALSNAPLPGVQFAGAGHVVLLYAGLVAMAIRLIRGTSAIESRTSKHVLATA